jgi:hypothetical protein
VTSQAIVAKIVDEMHTPQTIGTGKDFIFIASKNQRGSRLKYTCIDAHLDKKPITQQELLHKAWVATGANMKLAIRNYSHNGGQHKITHASTTAN